MRMVPDQVVLVVKIVLTVSSKSVGERSRRPCACSSARASLGSPRASA